MSIVRSITKQKNFYKFTSLYSLTFKSNSYIQINFNTFWAFYCEFSTPNFAPEWYILVVPKDSFFGL